MPANNKYGRDKLSVIFKRFLRYYRQWHDIEGACDYAGIHKTTFYRWLKAGSAGEEPYASFVYEFRILRSEAKAAFLDVIKSLAIENKEFNATKYYLENIINCDRSCGLEEDTDNKRWFDIEDTIDG